MMKKNFAGKSKKKYLRLLSQGLEEVGTRGRGRGRYGKGRTGKGKIRNLGHAWPGPGQARPHGEKKWSTAELASVQCTKLIGIRNRHYWQGHGWLHKISGLGLQGHWIQSELKGTRRKKITFDERRLEAAAYGRPVYTTVGEEAQ